MTDIIEKDLLGTVRDYILFYSDLCQEPECDQCEVSSTHKEGREYGLLVHGVN